MQKNEQPIEKKGFIGRIFERNRVLEAANSGEASILIVYGRRRVGKTELIEHTLRDRHLLKLEGVEGVDKKSQMTRVLFQLSKFFNDPFISKLQFTTWMELFDFIAQKTSQGEWTLYLEELQWLAGYEDELIADLKYVWDNKFRHNPRFLLVLCGSSPSFMKNRVVKSKALYNRSIYELNLKEFSISETYEFLGKHRCAHEIMEAYLSVGGIPEYLKRLKKYSSIRLGLSTNSFQKESYFSNEYQKILISSFAQSSHYKLIIDHLSLVKFSTRTEMEEKLCIKGGGHLTELLSDLVDCGFIERYFPYQAAPNGKLVRYCIADNYLRFYFKFIHPLVHRIEQGDYNEQPLVALNKESFQKWLGFAFERFCRLNHRLIASIIGFKAVSYRSGVFFNRATDKNEKGYQIDLIFDRADHVLDVCEIKFLQTQVGVDVIDEFEAKLKLLPNPQSKTIQKVLISAYGATDSLIDRGYFDYIISLEELILQAGHSRDF